MVEWLNSLVVAPDLVYVEWLTTALLTFSVIVIGACVISVAVWLARRGVVAATFAVLMGLFLSSIYVLASELQGWPVASRLPERFTLLAIEPSLDGNDTYFIWLAPVLRPRVEFEAAKILPPRAYKYTLSDSEGGDLLDRLGEMLENSEEGGVAMMLPPGDNGFRFLDEYDFPELSVLLGIKK